MTTHTNIDMTIKIGGAAGQGMQGCRFLYHGDQRF